MANVRTFIEKHALGVSEELLFRHGNARAPGQGVGEFYGIQVQSSPTSIMSVHSDVMFVISPHRAHPMDHPGRPHRDDVGREFGRDRIDLAAAPRGSQIVPWRALNRR